MSTTAPLFLGIEIGGTKLQFGVGRDDGRLLSLVRRRVDPAAGADGIRSQIAEALPELLRQAGLAAGESLRGVGVGFGGPVDDASRTVIKSHQIDGWDGFPLADWVAEIVGAPVALGNDADVAGLAEALHGAGKGLSPIFYITLGTGIGGGLVLDGKVYRGVGRGAAEIGHLRCEYCEGDVRPLELIASGWGIALIAQEQVGALGAGESVLWRDDLTTLTAEEVARAAAEGDDCARQVMQTAIHHLAESVCRVIALLCPRRIVVGGGVSLIGEEMLFAPLRRLVAERVFRPFAGLTDIVPAALGEEVVVHGAIALARQQLA